MPSGGAIIIDHTEALVSIDVNSARATKGADIEATALNTNVEAADEIARQLRLRDLGGLVVIDFIDMELAKNQREVENRLRDALRPDRARVQTGKISRFGLMELSRQRLQPSLGETSHIPCPRCSGTGHIRDTESSAQHILRILQEEAMKENTAFIHAQVPVDVATFLLNEKRSEIHNIEARLRVEVVLIPNIHLETPNYTVERIRHDSDKLDVPMPSYKMAAAPVEDTNLWQPETKSEIPERPQPVVKGITPAQPAPMAASPVERAAMSARPPAHPAGVSLISRIIGWIKGSSAPEPAVVVASPQPVKRDGETSRRRERSNERRDGRQRPERGPRPERKEREPKQERETGQEQRPETQEREPWQERQDRQPKGEKREREPRPPRQEGQQRPEPSQRQTTGAEQPRAALTDVPALGSETNADGSEAREGRSRRGRRGGRRERGDRQGRTPQQEEMLVADQTQSAIEGSVDPSVAASAHSTYEEPSGAAAPAVVNEIENRPAPAVEEKRDPNMPQISFPVNYMTSTPAPVAEAAPAPTPERAPGPTPQSVPERAIDIPLPASAEPSVATTPDEPKSANDINLNLASAGLELVETRSNLTALPTAFEEESVPRRPRRVRQRLPRQAAPEPLVQVETSKQ